MGIFSFLVSYWSQITVLVFGVGFLFQKIIEQKLKKAESRHAIFQKSKIETVMRFLSAYTKTERLWYTIPHLKIINQELHSKQIDDIISPTVNELISSKNELILFFEKDKMVPFEEIVKSVIELNNKLQEYYLNMAESKTILQMSNEFHRIRDKTFKENSERMALIGDIVRKTYNS